MNTLPNDAGSVHHLLQRLTFGPRPGDVERVRAIGPDVWLKAQLDPLAIPDAAGDAALEPYGRALATPEQLLAEFGGIDGLKDPMNRRMLVQEVGGKLQMSALARHVSSERQLYETMVDFWTNHFNVFARKGTVGLATGDYIERAIRPNALGSFETLLGATARHPAMLVYLDNAQSKSGAINENYARELMELHTLGVDGGYTQEDVVEVARILTGWSLGRIRQGDFGFMFRPRLHDFGTKTVLGVEFRGDGEAEGVRLLTMLASHASTARHIATKLCQRFIADDPSADSVAAVARAFTSTNGSIAQTVDALIRLPEFWSRRGTKVKTPLKLLTSAVRAVGGQSDGTDGLAKALDRLGQPLFLQAVPTGYLDVSAPWTGTSALLDRMKVGLAIAQRRLPGMDAHIAEILRGVDDTDAIVARVDERIFGGGMSDGTRAVIRKQIAPIADRVNARDLALAMAIASPDFQRC